MKIQFIDAHKESEVVVGHLMYLLWNIVKYFFQNCLFALITSYP